MKRLIFLFLALAGFALGQTIPADVGVFSLNGTGGGSGGSGTVTSVSFTGGLITVATATTTPAFTVAGTSGGIPYFSASSTWASSAALTANALIKGGGAGVAPSSSLFSDNGTTATYTGTGGIATSGAATGSFTATGSTSGAFVVTGVAAMAQTVTLSLAAQTSGAATLTVPDQVGVNRNVVSDTGTQTLTNKRVTARSGSTTSSVTPTINTDTVDFYKLTAQTADITSFTTNLSGTPVDGDQLEIRVTGTAARAITWGTGFVAGPAALPTTTVTTKTLYVYFEYDSVVTHWVCMFSGSLP